MPHHLIHFKEKEKGGKGSRETYQLQSYVWKTDTNEKITAQMRCEVREIWQQFVASTALADEANNKNANIGQLNDELRAVRAIYKEMVYRMKKHE